MAGARHSLSSHTFTSSAYEQLPDKSARGSRVPSNYEMGDSTRNKKPTEKYRGNHPGNRRQENAENPCHDHKDTQRNRPSHRFFTIMGIGVEVALMVFLQTFSALVRPQST